MKTKKENRFNDIRSNTFFELGTVATDWTIIHPVKFSRQVIPIVKGKRKGTLIERWIPEYKIPDGFVNPFESDAFVNVNKKC